MRGYTVVIRSIKVVARAMLLTVRVRTVLYVYSLIIISGLEGGGDGQTTLFCSHELIAVLMLLSVVVIVLLPDIREGSVRIRIQTIVRRCLSSRSFYSGRYFGGLRSLSCASKRLRITLNPGRTLPVKNHTTAAAVPESTRVSTGSFVVACRQAAVAAAMVSFH